ncbi:MAG TPA: chemotaxis protein CheB [Rhodocyclaceae bacterium]|nr:chemotaxis protein CheB [Rhodocyclaceae bacterium]
MSASSSHEASSRFIDAIVVGASAGGVAALSEILTNLPVSFAIPVIVVLHVPSDRPSHLPDIFRHRVGMRVSEAQDKEPISSSTLYFAPAGYHLSIENDRSFSLSGEAPVSYSRPSIDVLMTSAADAYGANLAGILLTGANFDGAAGLAIIKEHGGLTIVQDPDQAEMSTMPAAAIAMQRPDLILPLEDIHALLAQMKTN